MAQAEEVKSKLDIVEVIREYVPVKAVGANFQALCPFHNEKTPSFVISPEKQIWHCFGCGRGGDVFAFVMEKEGLGFMEALRLLAPKAGVTLKYDNPASYSKRNRILDILELSGKYYNHLLSTPAGQAAREYLLQRGLEEKTISDWQLGYSPDSWDSLYNFLKSRPLSGQKYTDEEIFAAGLSVKKDQGGLGRGRGYYDRFRDRIMFPIRDANANIVAFTARVNPKKEKTEKMGKYINSPQTEVYDKSRLLFALDKAKGAIRKADLAIVVEGQMDAIACHLHGFGNVVASSGTALTLEQLQLIKRYTKNIAFALDSDSAGLMASERGGDLVDRKKYKFEESLDSRGVKQLYLADGETSDLNIFIIEIKNAKDPDECLKNNPEDFRSAVDNKKMLLEYFFDSIFSKVNLEDIAAKKKAIDLFLLKLSKVKNRIEEDNWIKKMSELVEIRSEVLREELDRKKALDDKEKKKQAGTSAKLGDRPDIIKITREERLSELFLALIVRFPDLIGYATSNLEPDFLAGEENVRFYKDLIIYYNKAALLDYESFRLYLEEQGNGSEKFLDKLVLLGEKDFYSHDYGQAKGEAIRIIVDLKKYGCQKRIRNLEKEIGKAEQAGREEDLKLLMAELKNLTEELRAINLE